MSIDAAQSYKARVTAGFERIAADYDVHGPGCFTYFGRRLVELAGVAPGERVLDVASGRGAVLLPAAEQVGPAGEVVGVDISAAMARAANAAAAARGLAARVEVLDAERLPFPAASFDHVLCGFGLMFFPDLPGALHGFRRVLRPGGRCSASTWQVSQTHDLTRALNDLALGGPGEPGWISDPDQLADLLSQAGFVDVRVVVDASTFRYDDLEAYWQNARGTGERRRLDALDPEQTARVRASLAERVRDRQQPDGTLAIAASALIVLGHHEGAERDGAG